MVAAAAVLAILAAGWCGLWYYAASVTDRTLTGWFEREAAAGRVYNCASRDVSGFPFRIQVRCVEAAAALQTTQPPLAMQAAKLAFTAQVYRPTLLVGEVTSPVTVAQPGQPASFTATWSQARIIVSGVPPHPNNLAIDIQQPRLDRGGAGTGSVLFTADDTDFQGRIVTGSAADHPVIEAVLRLTAATAPSLHPLLMQPLQGAADVVFRGFTDLGPKPLAARFREMQAADGAIEIKSLRIERPDAIVTGSGTLKINAGGRLDGMLTIAVAGLENIVPQLGLDQLIAQGIGRLTGQSGQGQGLSTLDRFVPGLSGVVRDSANASLIDNLKKMGQPTEIDKKPAIALPLRFADGAVYLGILRLGDAPPLF